MGWYISGFRVDKELRLQNNPQPAWLGQARVEENIVETSWCDDPCDAHSFETHQEALALATSLLRSETHYIHVSFEDDEF